jgi:hypothetical protein
MGGIVSKGAVGRILAVACGVCALAAAGCGGSSDQPLTKAEFVKQGSAICKKAEERRGKIIAKLAEAFNPHGDVPAQQAKVITASLPTYEDMKTELEELGPPKQEAKKVEELLRAMEKAAERASADPHTAIVSNVQFRQANKLAEEVGLKACVI